ncbi:MAG: tripartite tricarboxylate transporter substrate binding protein [Burkholderiaceae bacterium]
MLRLLIACAGWLALGAAAQAQAPAWKPTRPIEIVNPAAPGGSVDLMSRMLKKYIEDNRLVDVPVNVVYKTGANGAIALDYVNQARGSGETVFAIAHTFLTIRLTGESKMDWRDLTPLGILFKEYHVTAVGADSPLKTGKDLIERMRRDPGSLSYGFFGNAGNHLHLAAAIPLKAAGVDIRKMLTTPYRSGPEAMVAAMGGHLDVALVSAVNPAPHVASGKLRVLTQTSPVRGDGYLKDVPTWRELGIDVDYATAQGFAGPRGMPKEAVAFWDGVLERMSRDPAWREMLTRSLWSPAYMNSAEMQRYYESEFTKLKGTLDELGLSKSQ